MPMFGAKSLRKESLIGPKCFHRPKTQVPTVWELICWPHALLSLNDDIRGGTDKRAQIVNENTQIGLVSALLLTVAWSAFFGVFAMEDVTYYPRPLFSPATWVDIQIVLFSISVAFYVLATISSVAFLIGASVMSANNRVDTWTQGLGIYRFEAFYSLIGGSLAMSMGFIVQGVAGARSYIGMALFILMCVIFTLVLLIVAYHYAISLFKAQHMSEHHPPLVKTLAELNTAFDAYVLEIGGIERIDMQEFEFYVVPLALEKKGEKNLIGNSNKFLTYWPGLAAISKERLKVVFEGKVKALIYAEQEGPAAVCIV